MVKIITSSAIVEHYHNFQEKKLRKKDKTADNLERLFSVWLDRHIIQNYGKEDQSSTEKQRVEISLAIAEILK